MHYLALVVSEVWLYILKCESLRSVLVQPLFTDEKTQVWVSACSSLWLTLFGHNICAEASSYHPTDPGQAESVGWGVVSCRTVQSVGCGRG